LNDRLDDGDNKYVWNVCQFLQLHDATQRESCPFSIPV
jgi:hypothetical protein